ncbi:MAG: FtsK/SpoIIIE domain-containing protein [Acidimicrobiales bacterium]
MAFTVVVRRGGIGSPVSIEVSSDDATVGDLAAALGAPQSALAIDGRRHDAATPLVDTALYRGCTIEFVLSDDGPDRPGRGSTGTQSGRSLVAVAGPDAGWRCRLSPGANVLGRSPDVELRLEDQSLSGRHARILVDDRGVSVADLGSTNGVRVGGHVVASSPLMPDSVVWAGSGAFRVEDDVVDTAFLSSGDRRLSEGTISFNRPPREAPPTPTAPVEVGQPPAEPSEPVGVLSIAAVVAPLLMAAVLVLVMGDLRFALFAVLSPLGALGGWLENRVRRRRAERRWIGERDHRRQLVVADIEDWVAAERHRRWQVTPTVAEWGRRSTSASSSLWERRPSHPDAMVVALGLATVEAVVPVADQVNVDPDVADLLDVSLVDVPVEVDLATGAADEGPAVIGIVGRPDQARSVARSILCSAASMMGPSDLAIIVACAGDAAPDWSWARWLPHLSDPADQGEVLGSPWYVDGVRAQDALARRIEVPDRRSCRLLVVDGDELVLGRNSAARRLMTGDAAGGGRWSAVVVADREDRLPSACDVVLQIDPSGRARVRWPAQRRNLEGILPSGSTLERSLSIARHLARFDDPDTVDPVAALPAEVPLSRLAGPIDEDTIAGSWARPPRPLVHLGVSAAGPVELDLAADGPHVLVAGTTGAGKSELLRSMVASLALGCSPADLNLILIDYKGGAAFDRAAALPHTVGVVTDLDENLAERALLSLEAELRHRETVLRSHRVGDMGELQRGVLARLVVLVDEFATLANELPEFLDSLVGVAQRGRSLGVHLVLATQRPAGAVNDNIRANTNIRVALRVQDDADSLDIVGVADAARLARSRPGRAVMRIGPDEPVVMQTTRVTGPLLRRIPLKVEVVGSSRDDSVSVSELEALVELAGNMALRMSTLATRRPWLDPLPTGLSDLNLETTTTPDAKHFEVALVDDPANQRQVAGGWGLDQPNLLLVGRAGGGPIDALRSVARKAAAQLAPDTVSLLVVATRSGALGELSALPHTFGFAGPGDEEMLRRILDHCIAELSRRRSAAEAPRLVLLIDDLGSVLGGHDTDLAWLERMDHLLEVLRFGPAVGIHTVAAVERLGAMPAAWQAAFASRWLFEPADELDLHSFLGDARIARRKAPVFVPGRALRDDGLEMQLIQPDTVVVPDWTSSAAVRMRRLPTSVSWHQLDLPSTDNRPWHVPLGLADTDLSQVGIDIHPGEHVLVAGPPRSGVSCALGGLAMALSTSRRVVVVAGSRSPLAELDLPAGSVVVGDVGSAAEALAASGPGAVVVIDDAHAVDDPAGIISSWLADAGPQGPVALVLAGGRADRLRAIYSGWTTEVRRSRLGLLLRPDPDFDGDLLGVRLGRELDRSLPGRGVVVDADGHRAVQALRY